jgi:Transglutaminase-like superfamily
MLKTLDVWAERVADHTTRRIGLYHKNPARFGSVSRFRITAMVHVLTSEFNLHYSPERSVDPDNWENPEDSFIHGPLGPRRAGTCANLPVLLTAIGQRLGYPLKLVLAPGHCFCRWDSPEERFNIEYERGGLNSPPDEHYRVWPKKWTPEYIESHRKRPIYVVSLTPQQDLSYCLHERAHHLDVFGRTREALATMQTAYRLWPNQRTGLWQTHLATKVHNPDKKFPTLPCEETAGKAAHDRLVQSGAIRILPDEWRPN